MPDEILINEGPNATNPVQGYTLNQQQLAERGLDKAHAALELLSRTLQANALLKVIPR